MATHLLDWVDGNTSKILEIKVDFKGKYVSVLRFFSTCQCLVSYDSSATSSMGAFSSDTPLDRVSGLASAHFSPAGISSSWKACRKSVLLDVSLFPK